MFFFLFFKLKWNLLNLKGLPLKFNKSDSINKTEWKHFFICWVKEHLSKSYYFPCSEIVAFLFLLKVTSLTDKIHTKETKRAQTVGNNERLGKVIKNSSNRYKGY